MSARIYLRYRIQCLDDFTDEHLVLLDKTYTTSRSRHPTSDTGSSIPVIQEQDRVLKKLLALAEKQQDELSSIKKNQESQAHQISELTEKVAGVQGMVTECVSTSKSSKKVPKEVLVCCATHA